MKRGMIASNRLSESRTTATVTEMRGKKLGSCGCSFRVRVRVGVRVRVRVRVRVKVRVRVRLVSGLGLVVRVLLFDPLEDGSDSRPGIGLGIGLASGLASGLG